MANLKLRCSSLPLAFLCGGSCRSDSLAIDEHNDAASLGSCVHAVLRDVVREGLLDISDLRPYAAEFGVDDDLDELNFLTWYGLKAWVEIKKHYPTPTPEYHLWFESKDGDRIPGHADVIDFRDYKHAIVCDFKSGRDQSNFYNQMMGYAAGLHRECPTLEKVTVQVVWLRDQVIRNFTIDGDDVNHWLDDFDRDVAGWDGTMRPGGHCEHCPRFADCPARRAIVQSAFVELSGEPVDDATALAPRFADLYPKVKVVESAIRRFRQLIRQHVVDNGPLALNDEKELRLIDEKRESIDAKLGWPVLSGELDEDELAGCVRVSKTDVMKAVGDKAVRGEKGKAKAELIDRLREAGAITEKPQQSLREVKRGEE